MPFTRPTLTDLQTQVSEDISSSLPAADALLRFSNLAILGKAQATLANLHYGYLDWISQQSTPFSATDEFLEGWAGLADVQRKPATSASGYVTFPGTPNYPLPSGTALTRSDGVALTTTGAGIVGANNTVTVPATINTDTTGLTGAFGNTAVGTVVTLANAVAGIQSTGVVSTAFTGGADIELDEALRTRMLAAYQAQPQGGAQSDYVTWATEVSGVSRAWSVPNGFGVGTVVVYVMLDTAEAASGGFPVGTNGVAASEARGIVATGDQLTVANYLYSLRPTTALVYVVAPIASPQAFTIKGIPLAQQANASAAIASTFLQYGDPRGASIPIAQVWDAVSAATSITDFVIVAPTGDIATTTGYLPTLGVVTWE